MVVDYHASESDLIDPSRKLAWQSDRKFKPSDLSIHGNIDLDYIEVAVNPWTYVACPFRLICKHCDRAGAHTDCIAIATDGGCRNNGKPDAQAAVGVYFGDYYLLAINSVLR